MTQARTTTDNAGGVTGLGPAIRRLRHARGLTLTELAERADLSHPFLSQLEREVARPSMAALDRVAQALGTSVVELISDAEYKRPDADPEPVSVVRAGDRTSGLFGGGDAQMLIRGDGRPFHAMIIEGRDVDYGDYYAHAEDEFVHVTDGSVVVDLGEQGEHLLEPGDSLYYAGGTSHRWRAVDTAGYRLFLVKQHAPAR